MAKISDLVKTYRLLTDPNAPDWNVKFVGGIVLALGLVAAGAALAWNATHIDGAGSGALDAPAATQQDAEQDAPPGDLASCDPTEVAEELARTGKTSLPKGHRLPSGCTIG